MVRLWCRLIPMDDIRLTNCKYCNVKNRSYELKCIFEETSQTYLFHTETVNFRLGNVLRTTENGLFENYKMQWQIDITRYPKLRTYRMFKSDYS